MLLIYKWENFPEIEGKKYLFSYLSICLVICLDRSNCMSSKSWQFWYTHCPLSTAIYIKIYAGVQCYIACLKNNALGQEQTVTTNRIVDLETPALI